MRIYIIRHGETTANRDGILQGQADYPLLEEGVQMAARVGRALVDVRFDAAFSSPLTRAMHTARAVLDASGNAAVPVCADDRLLELHMGVAQGVRYRGGGADTDAGTGAGAGGQARADADAGADAGARSDADAKARAHAEYIRGFLEMPPDFAGFPGGESRADLCRRTQEFLHELARKDYGTVLVSTHGCALRAMLNQLYDDPADFWHGHVSRNCAVSIVEVYDVATDDAAESEAGGDAGTFAPAAGQAMLCGDSHPLCLRLASDDLILY